VSERDSEDIVRRVLEMLNRHARVRNYEIEFSGADVTEQALQHSVLTVRFRHRAMMYMARAFQQPQRFEDPQEYSISIVIDRFTFIRNGLAERLASELMAHLDEYMRDWNNRNPARQAEERERQRREAQGRAESPPTFSGGMARPSLGASTASRQRDMYDYAVNRAAEDIMRQEDERFIRHMRENAVATTQYVTAANTSAQWINVQPSAAAATAQFQPVVQQERTYSITQSELRQMLAEAMQGIDIRISLAESDGEVSAEVEVLFEGEVVASDSDSIQL